MTIKESNTGGNSTSNNLNNPANTLTPAELSKLILKTKGQTTPTHEQLKKAYGSRSSQKATALHILKTHGSISTAQMCAMGWRSGGKRISELREDGHPIEGIPDWTKNGEKTYYYLPGRKGDDNG